MHFIGHGRQPKEDETKSTYDWELHWVQFPSEVHVAHVYGQSVAFEKTVNKARVKIVIICGWAFHDPNDLYLFFLLWVIL
jgi:hypothetical protein